MGLWTKDGQVVVDDGGQPVDCAHCPCACTECPDATYLAAHCPLTLCVTVTGSARPDIPDGVYTVTRATAPAGFEPRYEGDEFRIFCRVVDGVVVWNVETTVDPVPGDIDAYSPGTCCCPCLGAYGSVYNATAISVGPCPGALPQAVGRTAAAEEPRRGCRPCSRAKRPSP
jgi:hypothetical protein